MVVGVVLMAVGWVLGYVYGELPARSRLPYWLVLVVLIAAVAAQAWLGPWENLP